MRSGRDTDANVKSTTLAKLPPEQGIAAMQSINVAVLNPWFFAVFFGTPLVCAITALMAIFKLSEPGSAYVVLASLIYILGSLGVTMVFNVPLNNRLAAAAPASSDGAHLWKRYLSEWTFWNHVRTLAPLIVMALFILALCLQSSG